MKPTPADLIRAAEIEEALAEWFREKGWRDNAIHAHCRSAALRAMAAQTQEIE